ncbi:hypothetical protein [Bdellovibrio svalbardensis]|uniref:Uncharacterized protein n=1 Tax=Bdellovibrio svalbardensis TaxID=2972972 RepID=A0ABT6DIE5_9BACT|nr:hypothetical protein [Bdellovibrio svalbardensis]MDG0816614.1 hypothetical protein [Bdellovibrio svalbardensis]
MNFARLSRALLSFLLLLAIPSRVLCAEKHIQSEWTFGVDTQLEEIYFPEDYGQDTNKSLFKLELDPTAKWKYGEHWRFNLRPIFIANPDNKSEREKYYFDPSETYFKFQKNVLSIQVGFNLVTWGVTDGYNPVDIVNSRQIFDPLKTKKQGALSLIISESLSWFDYDFTYIPKARESILPGEQSRWLPREVFVPQVPDNNLVLILPDNLRYTYGSNETLNSALDNNFALRLQKSISIFDFSLSGFDGQALYPIIEPQVTGNIIQVSPKTVVQVNPDVVLNTKSYRVQQGGFSLVSHQWDFLFKYETSYSQPHGDYVNLPGWIHENVLGLEKTFNFSDGTFIGILQYSFLNTEKENDSNISLTEIYRRAWMAGGRISWKEVWTASLLGLYDSVHYSHFEEISIGRRLFDTWTLNLTADFISGSSENPLGLYNKNDSYRLSLSRSF